MEPNRNKQYFQYLSARDFKESSKALVLILIQNFQSQIGFKSSGMLVTVGDPGYEKRRHAVIFCPQDFLINFGKYMRLLKAIAEIYTNYHIRVRIYSSPCPLEYPIV